jgi:6,7-dimethyl-8-ribityllumazine synthase
MSNFRPTYVQGSLTAKELRFSVIVSRFNETITNKLLEGCLGTLKKHGADETTIEVMKCPGAYEIPLVAKKAAISGRYDAIICLGAVVRGDTPHFDYVAGQCASGIASVGLETGVPTIFGVLTADTMKQAQERAGFKNESDNKGIDAAMAAIEMVNLLTSMASQDRLQQTVKR